MKLAGYFKQSESPSPVQSKDAEIDMEKEADRLRNKFYENAKGFMLSGEPLSPEAMESILDALEFGIRQAKIINKNVIQNDKK